MDDDVKEEQQQEQQAEGKNEQFSSPNKRLHCIPHFVRSFCYDPGNNLKESTKKLSLE